LTGTRWAVVQQKDGRQERRSAPEKVYGTTLVSRRGGAKERLKGIIRGGNTRGANRREGVGGPLNRPPSKKGKKKNGG